jgi:hypothetical protein
MSAYWNWESSLDENETLSIRGNDKQAVKNLAVAFRMYNKNKIVKESTISQFANGQYCIMIWFTGTANKPNQ